MSEDNTWPDPARPGAPLNPERDGWHWISLLGGKDNAQVIEWFSDAMRWDETDWTTEDFGLHTRYLGPCLTPAEVDARVSEARRVALGECISICNAVAHANRVEYPAKWKDRPEGIPHDWQKAWETCAETAEDIAAEIRALGEKE